jgi:predicted amidophosphoribosyltransferase
VISAVQYSPVASKVLLSAKESNLSAADKLIVNAISHSLAQFKKRYGSGNLVGIPSRKSATRKRGRNFMVEITQSVAVENSMNSMNILQHNRVVRDQSQLDSEQRSRNIAGAFTASAKPLQFVNHGNNEPLIIVDDLITTGATLAEAIRALRAAGFAVIGAVTGAVAKPLR